MTTPHVTMSRARPGNAVIGWKLDRAQRAELLDRIAPRDERVVADHVTLAARVARDAALPDAVAAEAVGRIDDGRGVEALVVALDGRTERPDGGTYHITWSLAKGREPRESNDALSAQPWQPLPSPIPLALTPARWP